MNERKAGVLLTYVNMALGFVIPIFYTPIMLRMLGQSEYGLYSLANSVISYLGLLSLGLGSAIVRYLMRCRADGDENGFNAMAGLFLVIYSVISVLTIITGIGLTGFTGVLFGQSLTQNEMIKLDYLMIIMSLSTAVSFVSSVYTSVITCYERYTWQKIIAIVNTVTIPLLNILILYLSMASVGIAMVSLSGQVIMCMTNVWYCKIKLKIRFSFHNMPFQQLKDIAKYSAFVFIGLIADMLYWATDRILIGAMMGTVAVAIYNVGGTFQSILQNMSSAISNVFTPAVNRIVVHNNSTLELSDLLIRIGRIQYLIVSLILSGFTVFGRSFIYLWAGPEYEEAYTVAMLTMIPMAIPLIQSIAFTVIKAQGKHRARSIVYVVLAIINAVTTCMLIPLIGIIGAALCTCIVFVLGHGIFMNIYYYKIIGLDIPLFWKNIVKISVVPALMVMCCLVIDVEIQSVKQLFAGTVLYSIVFLILSWMFSMNRYEKELIFGLLGKNNCSKG